MSIFIYLLVYFIFGSIIGSFLNVVIWRMPRGQEIGGRSYCPHCHNELRPWHLIPLFSFIFLGGKCAFCRKPVSWRYFIIEFLTGLLFVLAGYAVTVYGLSDYFVLLRLLFILSVLVVVFVIDLEHFLILDAVIFPSTVVLLLLNGLIDYLVGNHVLSGSSFLGGGVLAAVLSGAFFYFLYAVSGGKWMGFGDVKFMAFLGLATGWPAVIVALMTAFFSGSLVGIGFLVAGKKKWSSKVPFGTFLSFGILVALFWAPSILDWYWSLIGR